MVISFQTFKNGEGPPSWPFHHSCHVHNFGGAPANSRLHGAIPGTLRSCRSAGDLQKCLARLWQRMPQRSPSGAPDCGVLVPLLRLHSLPMYQAPRQPFHHSAGAPFWRSPPEPQKPQKGEEGWGDLVQPHLLPPPCRETSEKREVGEEGAPTCVYVV